MRYWPAAVVLVVIVIAGCAKKESVNSLAPASAPATAPLVVTSPKRPAGPASTAPNAPSTALPHQPGTPPKGHQKPVVDQAAKALNLSTYPGAKLAVGPDPILRTVKGNQETVQADLKTPDQAGAVQEFYKKQLVKVDQEYVKGEAAYVAGRTASGPVSATDAVIVVVPGKPAVMVTVLVLVLVRREATLLVPTE